MGVTDALALGPKEPRKKPAAPDSRGRRPLPRQGIQDSIVSDSCHYRTRKPESKNPTLEPGILA